MTKKHLAMLLIMNPIRPNALKNKFNLLKIILQILEILFKTYKSSSLMKGLKKFMNIQKNDSENIKLNKIQI